MRYSWEHYKWKLNNDPLVVTDIYETMKSNTLYFYDSRYHLFNQIS